MSEGVHIVWFKRDLRLHDHRPLHEASRRGKIIPLYVIEPDYWQQPDTALRHWQFIRDSLIELDQSLSLYGVQLWVCQGSMIGVLDALHQRYGISSLWSHQETGNVWTYRRDMAVAQWSQQYDIPWQECNDNAVIRKLGSRDNWDTHWRQRMADAPLAPPQYIHGIPRKGPLRLPDILGYDRRSTPGRQQGGRNIGESLLHSFLTRRGEHYRYSMSSPNSASHHCSRLSPHLAWGTLSIREVIHGLKQRQQEKPGGHWQASLRSFESRLHWHCHFIQKLEDQPSLEYDNLHHGYDGLRDEAVDQTRFDAWTTGNTGFPFVDACMRSLIHDGWLNFRMRAMLVAFSSYHLWLHWRQPALHLARLFTDYEPGIHYSQIQMQSGTTGINTLRIYNPVKQSQDQDPQGHFIRRWIPELQTVPGAWIHLPWQMPSELQRRCGVIIGQHYPAPIVDNEIAAREARQRITEHRKRQDMRQETRRILQRHGSRKRPRKNTPPAPPSAQLDWDF
ncbi:MAG: deoxyribodipyrimidine photolyase [Gammaproteobacteria bacterium HGW-Gammaproteobacteria-14]|nr:MAG: deoxyribodipyrimidine photolyase [Gammaproteobacteria bacterium HGW-Gammaproteobacteria-14]